jgi:hypothetical protein
VYCWPFREDETQYSTNQSQQNTQTGRPRPHLLSPPKNGLAQQRGRLTRHTICLGSHARVAPSRVRNGHDEPFN